MDIRKIRIDKTASIEKMIQLYPAVCLCAMPGSGRKTAVSMLLQKHPEVTPVYGSVTSIEEGTVPVPSAEADVCWYVLSGPEEDSCACSVRSLKTFIRNMRKKDRLLLLADGVLPPAFLELIWSGQMEQVLPETFWFTEAETYSYLKSCHSSLNYREVYEMARGWPGCTAVIVRLQNQLKGSWSVEELCRRYEVREYVQNEILSALPEEELALLEERAFFPRLDEELTLILWEGKGKKIEEKLLARGIMQYVPERKCWFVHPLFRMSVEVRITSAQQELGISWYETKGYIREAMDCCRRIGSREQYRSLLIRHYDRIPFLQYNTELYEPSDLRVPELFYLRWMELLLSEKFSKLSRMRRMAAVYWKRMEEDGKEREKWLEILFNIAYTDPDISASRWMNMLQEATYQGERIRLYFMLGESVSYLGGIKDLSELFACSKKEQDRYRKIWKEKVALENQVPYRLAALEYAFLTDGAGKNVQLDVLEEDLENEPWPVRLGKMYLAYLLADEKDQEQLARDHISRMVHSLEYEEPDVCRWNTRALYYLAEAKWGEKEDLMKWIRETGGDIENVTGKTRIHAAAEAKIHLYLGNYSRSEAILNVLIPYFEKNRSWKWLAESLFQKAIIEKETGRGGRALRTVTEALAVANPYRYVRIFTGYGRSGVQLLEEYRSWMERENSEGTPRKRKYKYGSVLRMLFSDWLDYLVRKAGRQKRRYLDLQEEQQNIYRIEKLTVTEQMVLQYMEQGFSNAKISETMNIKLPTVKTHVYNIFKKLGVSTRIQAVQQGKEYGIL